MKQHFLSCIVFCSLAGSLFVACNQGGKEQKLYDTPGHGTINISVDESFKPVIEKQIKMYEASFPDAHIIAHYKPEAECFKDLWKDTSTRLIIVSRGLNEKEEEYAKNKMNYVPGWNLLALDAVVVLVNAKSTDSLFTLNRLREQMEGKMNRQQKIVFDGVNATGTVRFILDSVLKGNKFDTTVVKAAKNSDEVIDYIAETPNAIGLVGFSHIGNPEDTAQVNKLKKVKMAYVQCTFCPDSPFVKPMQQTISNKHYPLVRGIYYIINETHLGLGTDFTGFLKFERGQLIFRRAYLVPVMQFDVRAVNVNEKIPEN